MSDKLDLIRDKLAKARGRKMLLSGADYDMLDALNMIVNVLADRPAPSGEARCYRCDEPIASGEGVHLHDGCAAH